MFKLHGWEFSPELVAECYANARMLNLSIDLSNKCDLNCTYCFTVEMNQRHVKLKEEMGKEEVKSVISQAAELGAVTLNIVGAGEPLLDLNFHEVIEFAESNGMVPVVFTNGTQLARNPEYMAFLRDSDCSIVLKCESLDDELQDRIVQKPGYAQKMKEALSLLIEAGFAKVKNGATRLAIDSVIMDETEKSIEEIHAFCKEHGITHLAKPLIPCGRGKCSQDELGFAKIEQIYSEFAAKDGREPTLPFLDGTPCAQMGTGIYIDVKGNARDCVGCPKGAGNIRKTPLRELWKDTWQRQRYLLAGGKLPHDCTPRREIWKTDSFCGRKLSICMR